MTAVRTYRAEFCVSRRDLEQSEPLDLSRQMAEQMLRAAEEAALARTAARLSANPVRVWPSPSPLAPVTNRTGVIPRGSSEPQLSGIAAYFAMPLSDVVFSE